jgi:outer membrane protein assembly factor BamB
MLNKKPLCILAVLILLSSMAISYSSIIVINAQTQSGLKTYAFVGSTPNPVGVGQQTVLRLGITDQLAAPAYGWQGLTLTITHPDGQKETLGPFKTDSTGGTYSIYTPTTVGNYTLQSHFPQQTNPADVNSNGLIIAKGQVLLASDSEEVILQVLSEPIKAPEVVSLPTEYWTRPINDQYQPWQTIGGNWLPASNNAATFNRIAYGNDYAPKTPHLLWSKPITAGGLTGGALSPITGDITNQRITIGDAYQGKFLGSLIMLGNLYYDEYPSTFKIHQITAVNLHTGQELWSKPLLNNLTLTRGQLMAWNSINLVGTYPYLWATANSATLPLLGLPSNAGTTWCAFDPFTGSFVYALYGIPSGNTVFGENGEIIIYTVSSAGYMTMWNSTNIPLLTNRPTVGSTDIQQWIPEGKIINATGNSGTIGLDGKPAAYDLTPTGLAGYMWNVTIPKNLPGAVISVLDDRIIGGTAGSTGVTLWALSIKPQSAGQLLFNKSWQPPSDWIEGNVTVAWQATSDIAKDGVIIFGEKETRQNYAFSVETGNYLWAGQSRDYLDFYTMGLAGGSARSVNQIYDGKFYSAGYSGILYCYEATTGKLLWSYTAKNPNPEGQTFDQWPLYPMFIAGGMIYVIHTEHSGFEQSLPPEAPMICLNATNGEEIWRADGLFRGTHWGGYPIIGDSIIAAMNTYDQQIYAMGRGPSSTTVEAPLAGVKVGDTITIRGTINDVSPGVSQEEIKLRFPNGVPAIADANQTAWMRYVYQQLPKPANIQGVTVAINVVDANGNYRIIGTTTTDENGFYSLTWQPDISGKYTVIATFVGTDGYYGSSSQTAFYADDLPTATAVPTTAQVSATEQYFLPSVAAIILAIAIVGIVLGLLLIKRRP